MSGPLIVVSTQLLLPFWTGELCAASKLSELIAVCPTHGEKPPVRQNRLVRSVSRARVIETVESTFNKTLSLRATL